MLKFVYLVLGAAGTPFLMELVNTKIDAHDKMLNVVKGWPAYAINVIVCLVVSVIICVLPGGWEMSFFNVAILLFAIYFGNQFFFNSVVKPLMEHRDRMA